MSDLLTAAELDELSRSHPDWVRRDDGALWREVVCKDFAHALLLANAVGHLAEAADHHPDIRIHGYKKLELRLTSHDSGGITGRDRKLIERIEPLL